MRPAPPNMLGPLFELISRPRYSLCLVIFLSASLQIQGFEGEQRRRYILRRRREANAREKKIQAALINNKGILKCEVPHCGFDFKKHFGELGKEFAHVHHLKPLGDAPLKDGRSN